MTLTLPIKQDPATQPKWLLGASFTERSSRDRGGLKKSRIVQFARVVVIENKYVQVITEYEGPHQEYTEFFRRELTPVFGAIFELADGAPDVRHECVLRILEEHNVRSLGASTSGSTDFDGESAGWLFRPTTAAM